MITVVARKVLRECQKCKIWWLLEVATQITKRLKNKWMLPCYIHKYFFIVKIFGNWQWFSLYTTYLSVPVFWNKLKHNRVNHEQGTQPPNALSAVAADCFLGWAECREVMSHPLTKLCKKKVTILVEPLLPTLRYLKDDSGPQETLMLLKHHKHWFQNILFISVVWSQYIVHVIVTQFTWCNTGSTHNIILSCCKLEVRNCTQSGDWNSKCSDSDFCHTVDKQPTNPDFWHLQGQFHQLPVDGSVRAQHPFVRPAILRVTFCSG